MPVVISLEGRQSEILVAHLLKSRARKTRKRAEAQGAQDTVRIHILDPGIDIVATRSHLIEAHGLEAVFLLRSARYGIEPQTRRLLALDLPVMGTSGPVLYHRSAVLEPRRDVLREHIRRLDQMIVHADQNQVLQQHLSPFQAASGRSLPRAG